MIASQAVSFTATAPDTAGPPYVQRFTGGDGPLATLGARAGRAGVVYTPRVAGHELGQHRGEIRAPWTPHPRVLVACSCGWESGWFANRDGWLAWNEAQQHLANQLTIGGTP